MTTMTARTAAHPDADKLPLAALALAMTGFLALLTETLPAGMLLRISAGMGISETLAGQFVTLYAIGSVAAAVPLTAATQGWRRPPLLSALAAILVFNTLTALTDNYIAALAARFLAGMAGGLIWACWPAMRAGWWPIRSGRALAVAGGRAHRPVAGRAAGHAAGRRARLAQRVRRDLAADTGGHGLDPGEGARFRGTAGRQAAGRRPVLRSPACARCWPCWCVCWRTAFSTPMSRPARPGRSVGTDGSGVAVRPGLAGRRVDQRLLIDRRLRARRC